MEQKTSTGRLSGVRGILPGLAATVAVVVLVSACGADAGSRPTSPGTSSTSVSPTPLEDQLIDWCAGQTAHDCAYALWGVDGSPDGEWCLIDPLRCSEPPVTTIPHPGSTTVPTTQPPAMPLKGSYRRILSIVAAAHPGEVLEVALVLAAPLNVSETEALAAQLGLIPRMAWRTDYACIDMSGLDFRPAGSDAMREAPFDGPAMVAELRGRATTVTGYSIFEAGLVRLLRSGEALRQPGVTIGAFSASVIPGEVEALATAPAIEAVRLYQPEESDLPTVEVPDCEAGGG